MWVNVLMLNVVKPLMCRYSVDGIYKEEEEEEDATAPMNVYA